MLNNLTSQHGSNVTHLIGCTQAVVVRLVTKVHGHKAEATILDCKT